MSVRTKLAAFAVAVLAAFGAGAAVGAAVGPLDVGGGSPSAPTTPPPPDHEMGGHG